MDAEHLFNPDLATFMQQKRYDYEAHLIETICNETVMNMASVNCSVFMQFNYQLLNMILDELMPCIIMTLSS